MLQKFGLIVVLMGLGLCQLQAQDSLTIDEQYAKYHSNHFNVSPFFWLLGLKGEIIAPPRPSTLPEPPPPRFEIDKSFEDISNSIRFFIMLGAEYKAERWIIKANVTSLILAGEAVTPFEIITQGVDYKFSYLTSEITGGYRFLNSNKWNLDVLLGVRILYTKIKGRSTIVGTTFEGNRSVFWYDPIMGAQLKYRLIPKIELHAYTDFGPIRQVDSYQFQLQGAYHFTKTFAMAAGYRNYYLNSEADREDAIYKGRIYGPFIRFGFKF